jgi:hypothetical protein
VCSNTVAHVHNLDSIALAKCRRLFAKTCFSPRKSRPTLDYVCFYFDVFIMYKALTRLLYSMCCVINSHYVQIAARAVRQDAQKHVLFGVKMIQELSAISSCSCTTAPLKNLHQKDLLSPLSVVKPKTSISLVRKLKYSWSIFRKFSYLHHVNS